MSTVKINLLEMGCMQSQWEDEYSIHLKDFIDKEQFHGYIEELNEINRTKKSIIKWYWMLFCCFCLLGGLVPVVMFVADCLICGVVVVPAGILIPLIVVVVMAMKMGMQWRQETEAKVKDINERSSPCNWRLRVEQQYVRTEEGSKTVNKFFIEIETPNATSENEAAATMV